jgi:DNA-directed RNA polymerase subunit RPC12/RpoP
MNHSCFVDASGTNEDAASLTCPYCQRKFLVKKLLKKHMAKHTGKLI